jgi:peptidyl-dipeptidase A
MIYRNQSFLFREGANPGFHEGVGDILSLTVGTASYNQKLGLLSKDIDITDEQTNVNILFSMAMSRVAFMPFGYLVDKYRWDLYSGLVGEDDWNCHWVKLRAEIQGVMPPNMRSENHFDAGAKYHVAADMGYVRYFTAFVYEFQFYRALCLVSKQYDPNDPSKPLHQCNLFGKFFFLIAGV